MSIILRIAALPVTIAYAFMAVLTQDPEYYADAAIFSMNLILKNGD